MTEPPLDVRVKNIKVRLVTWLEEGNDKFRNEFGLDWLSVNAQYSPRIVRWDCNLPNFRAISLSLPSDRQRVNTTEVGSIVSKLSLIEE